MWTVPCLSCFCGTEGWSQGSADASQVVLPPGCIPRLSFPVQTLALRTPLSARWKRVCIASLATLGALGTLINVIKVTFLVSSRFFKVQHFHVFVCFCHCIYLCCKCAAFFILLCSVLLQGTSAHSVVQVGPEITAVLRHSNLGMFTLIYLTPNGGVHRTRGSGARQGPAV